MRRLEHCSSRREVSKGGMHGLRNPGQDLAAYRRTELCAQSSSRPRWKDDGSPLQRRMSAGKRATMQPHPPGRQLYCSNSYRNGRTRPQATIRPTAEYIHTRERRPEESTAPHGTSWKLPREHSWAAGSPFGAMVSRIDRQPEDRGGTDSRVQWSCTCGGKKAD